jgi:hypothetical protein
LDAVKDIPKGLEEIRGYDPDTGGCRSKTQTFTSTMPGLSRVKVDHTNGTALVDFSSKIRGAQYFDLIHLGSIEHVFDRMNEAGTVTFDVGRAIEEAELHKVDVTANLRPDRALSECLNTLSVFNQGPYRMEPYDQHGGIVFRKIRKTRQSRDRLIFYSKREELLTARNRQFLDQVGGGRLLDQFDGVLRVERNLVTLRHMRDAFGIQAKGKPSLLDVLASKESPLLQSFDRVTGSHREPSLFLQALEDSGLPFTKYIHRKGCWTFFYQDCGGDVSTLDRVLRTIAARERGGAYNDSARVLKYKLKGWILEAVGMTTPEQNDTIDHLRQLLEHAA